MPGSKTTILPTGTVRLKCSRRASLSKPIHHSPRARFDGGNSTLVVGGLAIILSIYSGIAIDPKQTSILVLAWIVLFVFSITCLAYVTLQIARLWRADHGYGDLKKDVVYAEIDDAMISTIGEFRSDEIKPVEDARRVQSKLISAISATVAAVSTAVIHDLPTYSVNAPGWMTTRRLFANYHYFGLDTVLVAVFFSAYLVYARWKSLHYEIQFCERGRIFSKTCGGDFRAQILHHVRLMQRSNRICHLTDVCIEKARLEPAVGKMERRGE